MLVDAPASVEEALALLLGTQDATLRRVACLAYIRRLYSPFLVTSPADLADGGVPAFSWLFEAAISSGARSLCCLWPARGCSRLP